MSSLSLLTLNCYNFPPLISYFGSSLRKDDQRIKKLADAFLKIAPQPDILTCQELWSLKNRSVLFTKIKDSYPYKFEDPHSSFFTLGSGLAIYSQYPIEKVELHRFKYWRGLHEFFAKKGFIIAKIRVDGKPIYVVATHLQAGAKNDLYLSPYCKMATHEIRAEQLKQINREVESFIKKDAPGTKMSDHPVFLTGDLNMHPNEKEYSNINLAFSNAKNLAKKVQSYAGTSFDKSGHIEPKMIDHIISVGKKVEGASEIIPDIDYTISDHLAVLGNVQL